MTTATPTRARLGAEAPGLVVMLDLAGATIAGLEDRIGLLEDALAAERAERRRTEALLDELRRDLARREAAHPSDTADVDPPGQDTTDT